MKYFKLSIIVILLIFIFSCEKTTGNDKCSVYGKVYYEDNGSEVEGVRILLFKNYNTFNVSYDEKETNSNIDGFFSFNTLDYGNYSIYAVLYDTTRTMAFESPIQLIHLSAEGSQNVETELFLFDIYNETSISGNVVYGATGEIAENAKTELKKLIDFDYITVDTTYTNEQGYFSFSNCETGNYKVYSSTEESYAFDILFANGMDNYSDVLLELIFILAEKPAIYIYPEFDRQFQVNLNLNNGTKLTKSIPEYNSGWDVFVEESGLIDHKYDYLFYETSLTELPGFFSGWCFKKEEMERGLQNVLLKIGLNDKETAKFLEYWLPRFDKYDYYKIHYLINEQLDNYVGLDVYPLPDSELRTLFFFEGCENYDNLPEPIILDFLRVGTTVVEWGGVLMN